MTKSFSGKVWNFIKLDQEKIFEMKRSSDISELVARILINRGISEATEIENFLDSKLKNTIPNPSLFLDMDKGVSRIIEAIEKKQQIMIIGDYDVDGITSTYTMIRYLADIGISPKYYIPNRFSDGYGVNEHLIKMAVENKTELLVVLDSGINSIGEIEVANDFRIDSIIIDHHLPLQTELPRAVAIINPNRVDQNELGHSHIKKLCAVGIVFIFLIALQRELKNMGFFKNKQLPDLLEFIDVVALGTICDVMELRGINRAVVKYTMTRNRYSAGISALMEAFNINKISSAEDLSFFIGPAINAAGRIGDPHLALNLFLEESLEKAQKIALKLVDLNKQRKIIEKQIFAESMAMIDKLNLYQDKAICVFGDNWNEGVIGIIAGKLKDKFQKPAFVISFGKDGIGKGSARSIQGMHLGDFFDKTNSEKITVNGGGHELAGGFSMHREKIKEFLNFMNSQINVKFLNSIDIDYSLSAMSDLDKISKELSTIEPFGKGMEKPIFCIKKLRIRQSRKTNSGSHLMFIFTGEFDKGTIKAILFNSNSKGGIVNSVLENKLELFDIVGSINYNEQFGSGIVIEDLRLSI
ncbi:MAG: single-stranded-DNA-specific exonuclease RecJ [Holosporales bacterium]|nr:single-stranded-DNA-specific exonuclease RecJ [Holosporales bacterium]